MVTPILRGDRESSVGITDPGINGKSAIPNPTSAIT